MKYTATINFPEEAYRTLIEGRPRKRSKCSLEKDKVKITAADATAFRATINSITQQLIIYEKMRAL